MEKQVELLTTQELAVAFGVDESRIRKLRLAGRLPEAILIGGTWVYPASLAKEGYQKKKAGRPLSK